MKPACESPIPIEAFVASLPKRSSVCVGVCTAEGMASSSPASPTSGLLYQIAQAWSSQTQRRSSVISGSEFGSDESFSEPHHATESMPQRVRWSWLGQCNSMPSGFSAQVARDVAGLTKLKEHSGLVLIELGPIDSPTAQVASQLCDGLVFIVQAQGARGGIASGLQKLQRPDCRWLGYWSLGATGAFASSMVA